MPGRAESPSRAPLVSRCRRIADVSDINGPDSKPSDFAPRRRRDDFEDFARTQFFESEPFVPDLDVTSSGFGGHASAPDHFGDIWRESSAARRWRHTLWLAIGFGAVVGSVLTVAVIELLPGTLRALGFWAGR